MALIQNAQCSSHPHIMESGIGGRGGGGVCGHGKLRCSLALKADLMNGTTFGYYSTPAPPKQVRAACLPACHPEALINKPVDREREKVGVFEMQSFSPCIQISKQQQRTVGTQLSCSASGATTGTKQHLQTAAMHSI